MVMHCDSEGKLQINDFYLDKCLENEKKRKVSAEMLAA